MGKIFCVEFQSWPLEIPHKISYTYIERHAFYLDVKIEELLELRAQKCIWNRPQDKQNWQGNMVLNKYCDMANTQYSILKSIVNKNI